jgi:hypothetical protein
VSGYNINGLLRYFIDCSFTHFKNDLWRSHLVLSVESDLATRAEFDRRLSFRVIFKCRDIVTFVWPWFVDSAVLSCNFLCLIICWHFYLFDLILFSEDALETWLLDNAESL